MRNLSARFGKVVRQARLARGFSQERLAERAELDRTFISMIERGVRKPTLETAQRLAEALGVPLARMIEEAEKGRG